LNDLITAYRRGKPALIYTITNLSPCLKTAATSTPAEVIYQTLAVTNTTFMLAAINTLQLTRIL
jgi:hypothetical protein